MTVDEFFKLQHENEVQLSSDNLTPKQIGFIVKTFSLKYAQYVLEVGGIADVVDWLPINEHPVTFTRLCKLKKCLLLFDNGEQAPFHQENLPMAISTHFKQMPS